MNASAIPEAMRAAWDKEAAETDAEIDRTDATMRATDGNGWPALIPLDSPNLPSVDPNALPGFAGEYAAALSEATETPPELATAMVLATCATAAARRFRLEVQAGYCETLNLWILPALPPGSRKSAVQAKASAPLAEWEREQAEITGPEIAKARSDRETAEARAKEHRRQAAKAKSPEDARDFADMAAQIEADLPEIPVAPRLWTSDATPEKLGALMAEHGECMAWLSSEGGIFDMLQGRYSGGIQNLDLVLKAWSGDPDRVDRGSRPPVYLQCPRLTIGLSPQPDVLRGLSMKPGFRGRGLLARFLYLLPDSRLGYRTLEPKTINGGTEAKYHAGIRAMLDWPDGEIQTATLTPAAHSEWLDFAKAIEVQMRPGGDLEHCTDWAGKAPGAAARIAGIMHGIEHAHGTPWTVPVSIDTMNAALELMAVITRHSIGAMQLMGADPAIAAARDVWQWIERGHVRCTTAREIYQARKGTFPRMAQIREALAVLEERGYIQTEQPPNNSEDGRGRPATPVIWINPKLSEAWQ